MSKFGVEYEYEYPKLKFHVLLEHLGCFLLHFIGHIVYISMLECYRGGWVIIIAQGLINAHPQHIIIFF